MPAFSTRQASLAFRVAMAALALAALPGPVGAARAQEGSRTPTASVAAEVPATVRGPFAERMDAFVRRAEAFGFDGQVLVEKDGRIILHGAYGFADRAEGRAMTVATPIGIASMSKQLVAAAVLALQEDGRLATADRLDRHVAGLPPELGAATLHELLTHTAGLRGGDPMGDFEAAGHAEAMERIVGWALLEPRHEWRYANVGYNLLAEVVESASGMPYERYLEERLFAPAGMERTGFWHRPPADAPAPSHAYRAWYDTGSPLAWPRNFRVRGAGDILSTAADLYRWELSLRAGTTLSEASSALAAAPQAAIDRDADLWYGYGLFVVVEEDGDTLVEHGGDWQGGYNGVILRRPADGVLVIVVANGRDGDGQWMRHGVQGTLDRLAAGDGEGDPPAPVSAPLSPSDVAGLPGVYRLPDGGTLRLLWDGARMWLHPVGDAAVALASGAAAPDSAALRSSGRTTELLTELADGEGEAAFRRALGEDGAPHLPDYRAEWQGLESRHGRLQGHELLGSSPVGGGVWSVHATLRFPVREVPMTFFWGEAGAGRLRGTFVRDAPNMEPLLANVVVRSDGAGAYLAHDVFRGVTARFRRDAGALVFGGPGWEVRAEPVH